jgi:hypothetical protein
MRLDTTQKGQHHVTIPVGDPLRVVTLAAILAEVAGPSTGPWVCRRGPAAAEVAAMKRAATRRAIACQGQDRVTVGEGGRVCAWLGCGRLVIDRVAGRPYCPRHVPWARTFADRLPHVAPPWLSTENRLPRLWAAVPPAEGARLREGQLQSLAEMEAEGVEKVVAALILQRPRGMHGTGAGV